MMEGWLTKRPDQFNIIWLDRYFILDGNQLRYYKKRGDPIPRGTYILTAGCVVGEVFNSNQKHKHHDAVWMFRITFSIVEGMKSYKKDRFVDLGAKTEVEANNWKAAIERAINSVREMAKHRENMNVRADIGATPAAVKKLLETDEDNVPILNLAADMKNSERGWWIARIQEGLRIMQEAPMGHSTAAAKLRQQAWTVNQIFVQAIIFAIITFCIVHTITNNMSLCFLSACASIFIVVCFGHELHMDKVDVPSYRVSQVVRGSPTDVFRLIMNVSRHHRWDAAASSTHIIQELDDHADILHVKYRPVYVWPIWQRARDAVVMRYWRREEDGTYIIMYQSTGHPECHEQQGYVRANMHGSGLIIAPQKRSSNGEIRSLVTYVLRFDPKGFSSIYSRFGIGLDLVLPMLKSIIGIRDEMAETDFIKLTVSSTTSIDMDAASPSVLKVDNSGAVQGIKTIKCNLPKQMWAQPDTSKFMVRGPKYLVDGKKIPAGSAAFNLVGVDLFSFEDPDERFNVGKYADASIHDAEFTFIVNMIIPGSENLTMVIYFQPSRPNIFSDESSFSDMLTDFLDGDDDFRNSRFKLIPRVQEGSFFIKQSVGQKPALVCNKLNCPYTKGEKYFVVNIDISSNSVANSIVGLVKGVTKSLVVDIAFLLESQYEEELPETILGAVRMQQVSLDNPVRISSKDRKE